MVCNPHCLISQIAVTFDEGDRAGVRRGTGPSQRGSMCVFFLLMCTDPAVPSASEQILL